MAKRVKPPQIFFIGREDAPLGVWESAFTSRDLFIYKILKPEDNFDLTEAGHADLIVVDVEDSSYRFHKIILSMILARFPDKKVVGLTTDYVPEISELLINSNASGYIYRKCHYMNAVECLKRILAGERCFINADREIISLGYEQKQIG